MERIINMLETSLAAELNEGKSFSECVMARLAISKRVVNRREKTRKKYSCFIELLGKVV